MKSKNSRDDQLYDLKNQLYDLSLVLSFLENDGLKLKKRKGRGKREQKEDQSDQKLGGVRKDGYLSLSYEEVGSDDKRNNVVWVYIYIYR